MSKYDHITRGWFEKLVDKLGGEERAEDILSGKLWVSEQPPRQWIDKDDVIRLSVTSDGTTGKDWIARLTSEGIRVEAVSRWRSVALTSSQPRV